MILQLPLPKDIRFPPSLPRGGSDIPNGHYDIIAICCFSANNRHVIFSVLFGLGGGVAKRPWTETFHTC